VYRERRMKVMGWMRGVVVSELERCGIRKGLLRGLLGREDLTAVGRFDSVAMMRQCGRTKELSKGSSGRRRLGCWCNRNVRLGKPNQFKGSTNRSP
jgi:hypothetical protein